MNTNCTCAKSASALDYWKTADGLALLAADNGELMTCSLALRGNDAPSVALKCGKWN